MTREYKIKTPLRTGTLTVTEQPDCVVLALTFDRYGEFGDGAAILAQLRPVLSRYDRDPRPVQFDDPNLGQRALTDFDGDGRPIAVVTQETRQ